MWHHYVSLRGMPVSSALAHVFPCDKTHNYITFILKVGKKINMTLPIAHSSPVYQGWYYFVSNGENIFKSGLVHLECPMLDDLKTQNNFTDSTFWSCVSCFTTTDKGVWLIYAGSFVETRRAGTFIDIYEE